MGENDKQPPEQNTKRRRVPDKLIGWLPRIMIIWLLVVGLLAGVSVWERSFLENAIPGIYWLFIAYGKIAGLFTSLFYLTSFFVCLFLIAPPHTVGIFGFFKSEPMWAKYRPSNSRLLVVGRFILAIFVCAGSLLLQMWPYNHIERHVDTAHAQGSMYHLAYMQVYDFYPRAQYVLVKCDLSGVFCRQLDSPPASYYLPWYWRDHDAGAKASLNYDPAAGEIQIIQVIKGDTTIYTYQP